jgi:hypothetical protein
VVGRGAEFARLWKDAIEGDVDGLGETAHLFWPWDARPDRDEAWKQRQIRAIGSPERFKVEWPLPPYHARCTHVATPLGFTLGDHVRAMKDVA